MWTHALVCCVVIGAAMAAMAIGPLPPKPEKYSHLEGCYIEQLDRVIPFSSAAPSDSQCMEYRCSQDSVGYVSCGAVFVGPLCKLVEDKHKPYPECCPNIVCPDHHHDVNTTNIA